VRLLALDLSLTSTGWATRTEHHQHEFGTWVPPKNKKSGMSRLHWIRRQVENAIIAVEPEFAIIEDLAFNAHDRNHERAGLAYLVRHKLWLSNIPYVLVAPTTLKKFATGKGSGDKSLIQKEVYKRWNIDTSNDNEADAVVLLQMARVLSGDMEADNKAQQECIKTLMKSEVNAWALAQIKGV
jgi:crossover junction endodeoxyribonuclease RuvC